MSAEDYKIPIYVVHPSSHKDRVEFSHISYPGSPTIAYSFRELLDALPTKSYLHEALVAASKRWKRRHLIVETSFSMAIHDWILRPAVQGQKPLDRADVLKQTSEPLRSELEAASDYFDLEPLFPGVPRRIAQLPVYSFWRALEHARHGLKTLWTSTRAPAARIAPFVIIKTDQTFYFDVNVQLRGSEGKAAIYSDRFAMLIGSDGRSTHNELRKFTTELVEQAAQSARYWNMPCEYGTPVQTDFLLFIDGKRLDDHLPSEAKTSQPQPGDLVPKSTWTNLLDQLKRVAQSTPAPSRDRSNPPATVILKSKIRLAIKNPFLSVGLSLDYQSGLFSLEVHVMDEFTLYNPIADELAELRWNDSIVHVPSDSGYEEEHLYQQQQQQKRGGYDWTGNQQVMEPESDDTLYDEDEMIK